MRTPSLLAWIALLPWSLVACADGAARCVTGMSVACACTAELRGVQTCEGDGTYGACRCAPSPDAATDAPASVDAPGSADAPGSTDVPIAVDAPESADVPVSVDAPVSVDVQADVVTPRDAPTLDAVTTTDRPAAGDAPTPTDVVGDRPAASSGLESLVTAAQFEAMFPHRGDAACSGAYYTWAALRDAARAFPTFAAEGTDEQRRRELAAFLANIAHETTGGWATAPGGPEAWGLCFREEVGCDRAPAPACAYCVASAEWPCASGQRYYGRGPMQLSYNFNYGQAGRALGADLLAHPDLVATDGVIAFETALWFWMTPQSPKPSCHDVMIGRWSPSSTDAAAGRRPGFGMTINIINGGLECGYALGVSSPMTPPNVADRVRFYASFTSRLGVTQGDAVECGAMQHY